MKNKFGRLTILEKISNKRLVRCLCGNEKIVYYGNLTSGKTRSCGCLSREISSKTFKKINKKFKDKNNPAYSHGFAKRGKHNPFYDVYHAIKGRCNTPSNTSYKRYGARGIKCLWTSFEEFKNDMYEGYLIHKEINPGRNTTIERIDNNGNYCKENCKWVTYKEQMKNKVR